MRVVRDGVEVYDGRAAAASSASRTTCARCAKASSAVSSIENFNDIKVGDVIECYRIEEVARTLAGAAQEGEGA